jgi:hypothetical protein
MLKSNTTFEISSLTIVVVKQIKYLSILLVLTVLNGKISITDLNINEETIEFFKTFQVTNIQLDKEEIGNFLDYYTQLYEGNVFLTDGNVVTIIDTSDYEFLRFGRDRFTPFTLGVHLSVMKDGSIVIGDYIHGIGFLLKYGSDGNLLAKRRHHHVVDKIVVERDDTFLVGGLYMVGFDDMLAEYDEDTFFPSTRSRRGIEHYYENARGYWIVRYDADLNPVDSLIATSGSMRAKKEADYAKAFFSFDVSRDGSIWLLAYPEPQVRHYDPAGNFLFSFPLQTEDVNMPPVNTTKKQWYKIKRKGFGFYWLYNLHVIGDKIVITYKTERDWSAKSNMVTVYGKDGTFIKRANIPYRFFKHENALYFWHTQNGKQYLIRCEL